MARITITRAVNVRKYDTFEFDTADLTTEQVKALETLASEDNIGDDSDKVDEFSELQELTISRDPFFSEDGDFADDEQMNFMIEGD